MGDMLVDELLAYIFCCGLSWRDLPRLALVCRYAGATRLSSPPLSLPLFRSSLSQFGFFQNSVVVCWDTTRSGGTIQTVE